MSNIRPDPMLTIVAKGFVGCYCFVTSYTHSISVFLNQDCHHCDVGVLSYYLFIYDLFVAIDFYLGV